MNFPYLLQIILVPAIFAPLTYVIGRKIGAKAAWIAFAPLAYTLIILTLVGINILRTGAPIYEEYFWAPMASLRFGLMSDGLSLPITFTVAFLCTLMVIYSMPYMSHKIHEEYGQDNPPAHATFYALYLLYAVGMLGTSLATNLVEFYLFYELMLVPSWALLNSYGYGEREKIALMYFLWTHAGAASLLIGIFLAFSQIGSFEIADLVLLHGSPMELWVAIAMLIGFFVKMAVFGLHIWLPYAHAEAPTPISALLSPAMIGLAAYASVRMVILPLTNIAESLSLVLSVLALITMVYGSLLALAQDDIKRLLAYSSISQMGYLLLGIASVSAYGVGGSMFHYVSHGLGKCILFSVAGAIIVQTNGIRSIKKLGGLASKMPITAMTFIIGFLTIGGVPPTAGFQSKITLFTGVFLTSINALSDSPIKLIIAIFSAIAPILTIAYALWTIRRIFFGPLPKHLDNVKEASYKMTIPLLILSVASVLIGIYPRFVTDFILPFISKYLP
jgi:NADH-quinone oxidoreductase subunit M